jgi:hypothetical protein
MNVPQSRVAPFPLVLMACVLSIHQVMRITSAVMANATRFSACEQTIGGTGGTAPPALPWRKPLTTASILGILRRDTSRLGVDCSRLEPQSSQCVTFLDVSYRPTMLPSAAVAIERKS